MGGGLLSIRAIYVSIYMVIVGRETPAGSVAGRRYNSQDILIIKSHTTIQLPETESSYSYLLYSYLLSSYS